MKNYTSVPNKRRTMYSNNPKFSSDLGSTHFSVDKKNMYKSAFSKTSNMYHKFKNKYSSI